MLLQFLPSALYCTSNLSEFTVGVATTHCTVEEVLSTKDAVMLINRTGKVAMLNGVGIFSPSSPASPLLFGSTTPCGPLLDESDTLIKPEVPELPAVAPPIA